MSLRLHELYLRHFARQYLDSAGLYNAAKHGLALTPQEEADIELKDILKRQGPAIHYLTIRRTTGQPIPRWSEVTHFVESDKLMTLIYRAITQIRMLWGVARFRYVESESTGVGVGLLMGLTPEEIAYGRQPETGGPMVLTDFSIQLSYWNADDPLDDQAIGAAVTGTPRERVEAAVATLGPDGWRLVGPEPFDGGWHVQVEEIADPKVMIGIWEDTLEEVIARLVADLTALRHE